MIQIALEKLLVRLVLKSILAILIPVTVYFCDHSLPLFDVYKSPPQLYVLNLNSISHMELYIFDQTAPSKPTFKPGKKSKY